MSCYEQWKPAVAMVGVDIALAIVNILLKKILNQGMNNLLIITYRQAISAIFLFPVAYFLERKSRPKLTARILCYLFFSALVGATLTQYTFLAGLEYTSATFSCAFINMVPVNTFIMALPLGLEKVKFKSKNGIAKMVGTMVCIGGALLLTLYRGMPLFKGRVENTKHKHRWGIGSIYLSAGSLMWSSWFLIQARVGKTYPCPYSTTAITSFFSAIQSVIFTFIVRWNAFAPASASASASASTWIVKGKFEIATIFYAGMVGSGLCYVVMAWCVKQRGPVFTAAFSPFIQTFVAICDVFILHEQIHIGSVMGSALVITGLYVLLWGKSEEAKLSALKINGDHQTIFVEENGDSTPSTQLHTIS